MSREISLFAAYSGKENTVTNYCGLIMKILYEEDPKAFEEVLATLLPAEDAVSIGPRFVQQTRQSESVPDLSISQRSFVILFETKLTDWFDPKVTPGNQISRHLRGCPETVDTKVLFLLSNFETNDYDEQFAAYRSAAREAKVVLKPITFEDLVGALEKATPSLTFGKLLDEFKSFLDRNNHLPRWKYLLDVVNCAGTMDEVDGGAYLCPATGAAYSHRRARYFGAYAGKRVSTICQVDAVVRVDINQSDTTVLWRNIAATDQELGERALQMIRRSDSRIEENRRRQIQVFLLSNHAATNFYKDSSGGMFSSKVYFRDIAKGCDSADSLARLLQDEPWSKYN